MSNFYKIAHWIITSVLIIASFTPQLALAQTGEETWTEPLNLSHSGTATNPSIVIDSAGTVHAVWQDDFANFVYARFTDGQWSAPQQTSLHLLFGRFATQGNPATPEQSVFTATNPLFIAGPGEFIFAVWITPQGGLYASRVPNGSFNYVEEWYGAQPLASSVTAFTAAVDADGALHVVYIRPGDGTSSPAGIYYIRSGRNGRDWSFPALLYESPYFRTMDRTQANISVTIGGTVDAPHIYVVWDNRSRKQVFLAKSIDGGTNWEPALQIAGPVPDSGLDSPFDIRVGAKENNIVLTWQSGQPEGNCTEYFQSSSDAGLSWSVAQLMFANLPGCALTNEFVTASAGNPEGVLYLLTNKQGQIFLSAWNGIQWSEPQAQPILAGFEDPEIYTRVEYDCQRAVLSGEQLYIVGCDRGGGGDIWVTSRSMASTTSWFSPQVWSQPALVTSDSFKVKAIDMVATGDNLIHAFFSQRDDSSIYYTRWDGTAWSRVASVLELPKGEAEQPAVAAGPADELFLIARSSTGSLYFSRAYSSEAVTPSSWSKPIHLPTTHDGSISPADIAWDADGTVTIAFSVPVNDERGVYIIQSKDRGETWAKPIQVFDGTAADFEVVGSPSLQISANGLIYIMWKKESIPTDGLSEPISLYFALSEDEGHSFGNAELVIDAPVSWRNIMTDSQGNLHRFWQRIDLMKTLWDQASLDGGHSWQSPEQFPTEGGIATVAADNVGGLHLVDVGSGTINYWLWDGSRWQAEPPTHWTVTSKDSAIGEMLASSVNMKGIMVVIFGAPISSGDATERQMFFITRTFTPAPINATTQGIPTQPVPSPTVAPVTTPTGSLLTASTTVAIKSTSAQSPVNNIEPNNPTSLLKEVLLPIVLLLIAVVILVYLRSVWGKAR